MMPQSTMCYCTETQHDTTHAPSCHLFLSKVEGQCCYFKDYRTDEINAVT
jgi:hypothetical protein